MAIRLKDAHTPLPAEVRRELKTRVLFDVMSADLIKEFNAFIFEKINDEVKIAAIEPANQALKSFCMSRFGEKISWYLATSEDINSAISHSPSNYQAVLADLALENFEVNNAFTNSNNIIALVDRIIKYALDEKASDIHIERIKDGANVRYRMDGVLHTVLNLPRGIHQAVIARFKILANLKIDEYRRPQDGRIELENHANISLRVSTAPTLYGEKIAMRILNEGHKNLGIEHLGFSGEFKDILLRNIEKPFGMIITSGPTGSGKTTTLYGLINLLQKDQLNISTLEDPVEFAIEGVNQIQVNPRVDLTFASGLRTLLRQDPDVIMVGEIRDSETAVMAANAALTGHLVLTTIHTNDSASVFPRLLEMKVEDFMVGSIINLVIAQRLVRRICTNCQQDVVLDPTIIRKIRERSDVLKTLETQGVSDSELIQKTFRIGKGCSFCMNTGYAGRVGLFEILEPNKEIHDLILEHAPSDKIREAADKIGFVSIIADGVEKVLAGHTTIGEVLRTTRNV